MIVFLCAIMFAFFTIDVLKIIGARQLKRVVTDDFMHLLNRIIGVILLLFGLVMLGKGIQLMFF
jgi:small neutral amino acid transporter SnatA (MarC family)